jgi:hypothetical protein
MPRAHLDSVGARHFTHSHEYCIAEKKSSGCSSRRPQLEQMVGFIAARAVSLLGVGQAWPTNRWVGAVAVCVAQQDNVAPMALVVGAALKHVSVGVTAVVLTVEAVIEV